MNPKIKIQDYSKAVPYVCESANKHTHTDGSVSITSTADAGGNKKLALAPCFKYMDRAACFWVSAKKVAPERDIRVKNSARIPH